MKPRIQSILLIIAFLCPGLLLNVQAVSPPPDGCYPTFTTAEGCDALNLLTTGAGNTGLGWRSLFSDTEGSFNTGVGAGTLVLNNADSNTAVGTAALLLNTTGTENTAIGTAALVFNETADQNTATGAFALYNHVSGNGNTAYGSHALSSDTSGQLNTAVGVAALASDDNGFNGSFNTGVGASALFANNGGDNTAVGAMALQSNTTGNDNIAIGVSSLGGNTSGNSNIGIGTFAGVQQTTGSNNIYIGFNLQGTAGENDACYIKSVFNQTSTSGVPVYINANHKLGTVVSSKRFKEDIKPIDSGSQVLFALKPVTFHYKKEIDPARISQFGLVAEDVEKVNPDLVVHDNEGKPYSVRYEQVNAMLLNEFLKAHQKIELQEHQLKQQGTDIRNQQATIDDLKQELRSLSETAKAQASELKQVSARLQMVDHTAARMAANRP